MGSKTTYGMLIICPLVENWKCGVECLFLTLPTFHGSFFLTPGFFPKNKEISAPLPCGLEYIYFMKIGQPKLSESKGQ